MFSLQHERISWWSGFALPVMLMALLGCGSPIPDSSSGSPKVDMSAQQALAADAAKARLSQGPVLISAADSQLSRGKEIDGAHAGKPPFFGHPSVASQGIQQMQSSSRIDVLRQGQNDAWEEWYEGARESPDVGVRLQALEVWAQQSGGGMDLLANALLDEDDAVRERAEELYEQQLEREADDSIFDEGSTQSVGVSR